jgi:hypothetical protein
LWFLHPVAACPRDKMSDAAKFILGFG